MNKYTHINTIHDLHELSWYEFETFSRQLLKHIGYDAVTLTDKGPHGGDDGIDLDIYDNGEHMLGQCKRWTKNHGLIKPLRELAGSLKKRGLERGIFLVSASANNYERTEAEQYGITLLDAHDILSLIHSNPRKNRNHLQSFIHLIGRLIFGILKLLHYFVSSGVQDFLNDPVQPRRHYKRRDYRRGRSRRYRRY